MTATQPVIGSLFSGYGGLDMAVAAVLRGRVAWHCEWDDNPSKILAHHWPSIPNHRDVTAVDWHTVEPIDVLTGGFPCQDVSHAGRRAGLIRDGEGRTRSGLWGEMLKAIDTLRPRLVVAENVRGLLSAPADSDVEPCPFCMGDDGASPMRALGAVLADLADIGYDAAWVGLPASGVGAPHGRFRVFILAWPADTAGDAWRVGHGDALRPWRGQDGRAQDTGHRDALTLLPTPAVNDMGRAYTPDEWDAWTEKMRAAHGNGNGHGASLHVEALRMLPTPRAGDGEKGGPNQAGSSGDLMLPSAVQPGRFGEYAPAIARWENVLGRPAPAPTEANLEQWERRKAARLSSTLPVGMRGSIRFIVDGPPHRLSPAFVEWLMGLPAGHVTDVPDLSRNAQLKALGNGVVPQQAASALEWLLNVRDTYANCGRVNP